MLNVDYNTFKRVTRNPSTNRGVGAPPRHDEVRRAHQMLIAALVTRFCLSVCYSLVCLSALTSKPSIMKAVQIASFVPSFSMS